MKVAEEGFFNNLAEDSDIIKSGPKMKKKHILTLLVIFFIFYFYNLILGARYFHNFDLPERFCFIFLGGAFTLADLISGVIPLITL